MNKLTTIKTIKKAAPLALLAVVMSGSAFAGPGKGQGPKDKGPKGEPQASIDVFTLCDVIYEDGTHKLVVTTTITDTGGDTPVAPKLGTKTVQAKQKGRGPERDLLGLFSQSPAALGTSDVKIDICADAGELSLNPNTRALNAEISVELENGSKATYGGRCEDDPTNNMYDEYGNLIYVEALDESNIDFDASLCLY